jgi:chemotaxis protein histidine kinase CheA
MKSPIEPRIPKWMLFLAIDAGLLLVAFIIVFFAKDPYAPLPFVSAVLCAVLAITSSMIPFLLDEAAKQAESTRAVREQVEGQVARLAAAGESLARAAAHIKAVEEAVHKSARDAETLPYRMQEKLAEFNEALAEKENEDREALERELEELRAANSGQLKAVAEKISKATAEWSALEASTRKQLATAQDTLAKLQSGTSDATAKLDEKFSTFARHLDERLSDLNRAPAATPAKAHRLPEPEPAASLEASDAIASFASAIASEPVVVAVEVTPAAIEPATNGEAAHADSKPKKPRAPRKAKPEETLAAMSETFVEPVATEVLHETPVALDEGSNTAAGTEASSSADGATRLLATAYIGIGNKLFIRGDGPGLSWDRGVPMQFVSIGKWGWHTHDAANPVRIKLYKNDESAALSGELTLDPGRHTEITALF